MKKGSTSKLNDLDTTRLYCKMSYFKDKLISCLECKNWNHNFYAEIDIDDDLVLHRYKYCKKIFCYL